MGCGGLCSKCHREVERTRLAAAPTPKPPVVEPSALALPTPVPQEAPSPVPAPEAASPSASPAAALEGACTSSGGDGSGCKAPTRCLECKKKVGLTGFKCKCGNLYCGQHRYAESHNCPFDYKTQQRQKLAESNPVVQASKVQRI